MTQAHSPDIRQAISDRAYFISQAQGFAPGRDFENWVIAEAQVTNELQHQPVNGRARKNGPPVRNAKRPASGTVQFSASASDTEVPVGTGRPIKSARAAGPAKKGRSDANSRD